MTSQPRGVEDLVLAFGGAGLGSPPVPSVFCDDVLRREEWLWSTRGEVEQDSIYALEPHVIDALTGSSGNYLAVAHGGHGVNSYAITYLLGYGRLSLLAQAPWGGVYEDADQAAAGVTDLLSRCSQLIAAYESAAAAGLLPDDDSRLVVVEDAWGMLNACGWVTSSIDRASVTDWLATHAVTGRPTAAAASQLQTRRERVPPVADLSQFDAALRPVVAEVLERHSDLPRPGPDYAPWITGSLGELTADVWFVAENPSVGAAAGVGREGSPEDQWSITSGDRLFRRALVDHRFEVGEPDHPGGWRCYITDVIKSPYVVGEFNAQSEAERQAIARYWAAVLDTELKLGRPRLIVTLGTRASAYLDHAKSAGLLPHLDAAREAIHHYVYVQSRPQGNVPGGDAARVAAWRDWFARIAAHPARLTRC